MVEFINKMDWDKSYENNFKIETQRLHNVNKNQIYEFELSTSNGSNKWYVFINSNYPFIAPTIEKNLTPQQRKTMANSMSMSPERAPEREESRAFDPLTGRILEYKKITPRRRTKYKPLPKEI